MAVRLDKPWIPLTAENVARLAGHLGVYQLADDADEIVYIGAAGARSLFGLKGELGKALDDPPDGATQFRVEVNMAYHTRHIELLQVYWHDHGGVLPAANGDIDTRGYGRLRPG
jgi:hypothetical protein